jgi:parallel beta-helix repeat protein
MVDCSASSNTGTGIFTVAGCTLTNCAANGNTSTLTTSAGISTGPGCTITACTAFGNTNTNATPTGATGAGISVGGYSNVQNCSAYNNKGDGIRAENNCIIVANTSSTNGSNSGNGAADGAGVHVTNGADNRIEGNNVTSNDRGIYVSAAGNLIIKNSASGNGPTNNLNYVIVDNNRYGPIIDDTPAVTDAVNGNSATGNISSNHPWANFSY